MNFDHIICSRRAFMVAGTGALAITGKARAEEVSAMHVVLLGDSIFDNAAYIGGGPDVITQLQGRLPAGWRATLGAVDGSVMADVDHQLKRLPADATHLVVSIGGNDALGQSAVLGAASHSVADTLMKLADIQAAFRFAYARTVKAVLSRNLPAAFCTIYDPRYPDPVQRRVATTALAIINDCITREVVARSMPLVDLRLVCDEDSDLANPIEPSVQGGGKIATAIAALLSEHDFSAPRSVVFAH
ncbi:MAG TPA: SGNH/GDSL hydrolase family protein [Dongiaceae bacterium]|nr:SGNH/GDSL hydrolase family protein [Dongiaceae bacterium]